MTVPELEDALCEWMEANTSELTWYRSNDESSQTTAPMIYRGLVARNEVGQVIPGDITVYPGIIVGARSGVQSNHAETVTVEVTVGTFDDSLDRQGYRDAMQLVERIKQRIREQSIVRKRFPLRMPLNWQMVKNASQGVYFFATIQLTFELPISDR